MKTKGLTQPFVDIINILKEQLETQKEITQVYKEHNHFLQEHLNQSNKHMDEVILIMKQLNELVSNKINK